MLAEVAQFTHQAIFKLTTQVILTELVAHLTASCIQFQQCNISANHSSSSSGLKTKHGLLDCPHLPGNQFYVLVTGQKKRRKGCGSMVEDLHYRLKFPYSASKQFK